MEDASFADISELLKNAADAFFVLNERGKLVFTNPALDRLVGVNGNETYSRDHVESELLRPPDDFSDERPRVARRPWGDGKARRWIAVTFLPIRTENGLCVAVLGHATSTNEPLTVALAVDALARERLERLRERQREQFGFESLPARSEPMLRVMHQLKLASGSDTPCALVGEAGTGKKSLAKVLHFASDRRRRNVAVVDCRILTHDHMRQELLGTELVSTEGKAGPASSRVGGLLHEETGGTLVLLGVARLSVDLQELLVREVGKEDPPRWRIVATERETLESCFADGRLVRGLYYLLSRFVIFVPPLRDRNAELPDHCQWVLERLRAESRCTVSTISAEALEVLGRYSWPGNLVELESVIRSSVRRASKSILAVRDLPRRFLKPEEPEATMPTASPLPPMDTLLAEVERRMVDLALEAHRGNKSRAAASLGISRQRLLRRAHGSSRKADVCERLPDESSEEED